MPQNPASTCSLDESRCLEFADARSPLRHTNDGLATSKLARRRNVESQLAPRGDQRRHGWLLPRAARERHILCRRSQQPAEAPPFCRSSRTELVGWTLSAWTPMMAAVMVPALCRWRPHTRRPRPETSTPLSLRRRRRLLSSRRVLFVPDETLLPPPTRDGVATSSAWPAGLIACGRQKVILGEERHDTDRSHAPSRRRLAHCF